MKSQSETLRRPASPAQHLLTIHHHPVVSAAESRVHGEWTMSINSISAASVLNAGQSPLLSLTQGKHRKHASVSDVQMQNPSASAPAASGQSGAKVNITA
jgi:hypothetical protein